MKIYLDYVFFINFLFDLILLFGIAIILKRNVNKKKIIFGALFGAFSFLLLFFSINSFLFFLLKMFAGFLMVIITFSYKDFRYTFNNFLYLMILSVIMGGGLYLIDIEAGYTHIGMLFFTNGKKINLFLLVLIGFFIIFSYYFLEKRYKVNNKNRYKTSIFINSIEYKLNGFLDTGNELFYFNKPCLILNKGVNIDFSSFDKVFIPFTTINSTGVFEGFVLDKIFIEGYGFFEKVVVALSNDKFHLDGADIILNINLLEGKNENN